MRKENRRSQIGETVTLVDVRQGSFAGRVVASVQLANGEDLATLLIEAGHGIAYDGGERPDWGS